MRDYLLDLVEHTHDLGCIDLIKIIGTDRSTQIVGLAEDMSVVVEGEFKNPHADFAKLALSRRSGGEPDGINFENAVGDFKNNYRFMAEAIVSEKLKTPKFKGVNWHIEFEPSVAAIQRLRMQAQANAEEPHFQARTENGDLKFFFGDHSTHAGNFVFHPGVSGQLKRAWSWPVQQVMSILALTGDKTIRISDDGAAKITVDSGLAVYNYILPAQSK
jgi:hypothetical protein